MFSSNLTKFFAAFVLLFSLFSACGWRPRSNTADSPAGPEVADELKSEIPFSTGEPERFQAEIVVTTGESVRRTFIARDGANRRWDFDFGTQNQLTNLQTDKNYLVLSDRKIYTEIAAGAENVSTDDWTNFLTTEWLSQKTDAKFEKLETADNLTQYRVLLDDTDSSEIFLFIDEKIGLPVRQEFYARSGDEKVLTYKFELKNLKIEPDAGLFTFPADFRRVSAAEFRKIRQSIEN